MLLLLLLILLKDVTKYGDDNWTVFWLFAKWNHFTDAAAANAVVFTIVQCYRRRTNEF